jgi:hypothetical protein
MKKLIEDVRNYVEALSNLFSVVPDAAIFKINIINLTKKRAFYDQETPGNLYAMQPK